MNRFKGLDLVHRVPEKLWTNVCNIIQEAVTKTIPKEKKCKKARWLSEEALQIAEERREVKSKKERKRLYPTECRVPENSKKDKKLPSMNNAKKQRKTEWERLEISSRELEISREHFMQGWA